MLLRPAILITAAAGLVAAAGETVFTRDFASIKGALDNVNALLLQINDQITNLSTQNIASQGPALLQLASVIQPTIGGFSQQIGASAPLTVDETNGLNTARTALSQNVNLTMADLINQKPLFDSIGLSSQVAGVLQQVHDEAANLFGGIQSKLAASDSNSAIALVFTESLNVFETATAVFRGQAGVAPPPGVGAPARPALPPTSGLGTIATDGSCACNVMCPAGSFT